MDGGGGFCEEVYDNDTTNLEEESGDEQEDEGTGRGQMSNQLGSNRRVIERYGLMKIVKEQKRQNAELRRKLSTVGFDDALNRGEKLQLLNDIIKLMHPHDQTDTSGEAVADLLESLERVLPISKSMTAEQKSKRIGDIAAIRIILAYHAQRVSNLGEGGGIVLIARNTGDLVERSSRGTVAPATPASGGWGGEEDDEMQQAIRLSLMAAGTQLDEEPAIAGAAASAHPAVRRPDKQAGSAGVSALTKTGAAASAPPGVERSGLQAASSESTASAVGAAASAPPAAKQSAERPVGSVQALIKEDLSVALPAPSNSSPKMANALLSLKKTFAVADYLTLSHESESPLAARTEEAAVSAPSTGGRVRKQQQRGNPGPEFRPDAGSGLEGGSSQSGSGAVVAVGGSSFVVPSVAAGAVGPQQGTPGDS